MNGRSDASARPRRFDVRNILLWFQRNTIVALVLLLLLFIAIVELMKPGTVNPVWLSNTLLFAAPLGILAAGQTMVMLTGGIDLSVVSVATGSAFLMTTTALKFGNGPAVAIGLGLGLAVGAINGLGVAVLGVQPLVMTLGTGLMTEGVIIVARQYAGRLTKTKHRPKRLEVSDELFVILGEHRARLEELELYSPAGPIFPAPHRSRPGEPRPYDQGECLTTRSLRAVVHLAGLPNQKAWSSHSLRDTFATLEAIGHGGDLATTAQRTRHKSIPALARYIRAVRRQTPPPGFTLPSGDRPPLLPPRSDDPEPTK